MKKIAILGGGSWGTTLANLLAEKGLDVSLWNRNSNIFIKRKNKLYNKKYLPDYELSKNLLIQNNLEKAINTSQLLIIAIPSKYFKEFSRKISKYLTNQKVLILTKGIEKKSFMTMSEVFIQETKFPKKSVMVLSGPNIADEIMRKNISASVIAGKNLSTLEKVSQLFNTKYFKTFISQDIKGVEMSGALKNLYAICSGLSDGLGFESNTKAMLLTRALKEMSNLFQEIKANPKTLLGLSGVGDLIATSSSTKSRNYSFGFLLGQGISPKEALDKIDQSVEGFGTLEVIFQKKNKFRIKMPIVDVLYQIIYLDKNPKKCFLNFLNESGNIDT